MSSDNFTPTDYLTLSREIDKSVEQGNDIKTTTVLYAWIRSAISRSYFSAYLSLRVSLLDSNKWPILQMHHLDPYENVQKILETRLPGTLFGHTANNFRNLRRRRNHADYYLPGKYSADLGDVKKSNNEAKKVIDQIPFIETYFTKNPP